MYCHHTAEQSKSAGIPAMNLCMNCHVLVREGTHSGKFEIAKIVEAVEKQSLSNGRGSTTCLIMSSLAMPCM